MLTFRIDFAPDLTYYEALEPWDHEAPTQKGNLHFVFTFLSRALHGFFLCNAFCNISKYCIYRARPLLRNYWISRSHYLFLWAKDQLMIGTDFQPKMAFRALKLIFYSLNLGLLIFFFVIVGLNDMQIPPLKPELDIINIISLLLLALIPLGNIISNRRTDAIDPGDLFPSKFAQFQTAMIIRWALIEGPALFALVGFMLLEDSKQLALFLICILALSANTINKEKATRMAKLNVEESKALE